MYISPLSMIYFCPEKEKYFLQVLFFGKNLWCKHLFEFICSKFLFFLICSSVDEGRKVFLHAKICDIIENVTISAALERIFTQTKCPHQHLRTKFNKNAETNSRPEKKSFLFVSSHDSIILFGKVSRLRHKITCKSTKH